MFEPRVLGRSGLKVGPIGIGSSYGVDAKSIEEAFHRGANYLYWGSARTEKMARAIRNLKKRSRDQMAVAVQVYLRDGVALQISLELALRRLGLDYADALLLGWHNRFPKEGFLDGVMKLKEKGRFRALAVSGHQRTTFQRFIPDERFDIVMTRYNAAHRGCETEVFPYLPEKREERPGVVTYTTTRWGHLLSPSKMPPGEKPPRGRDCYRFALSHPDVDLCLCGPANREQLNEALAALEEGPMNEEEMERMRRIGDHIHGLPDRSVFLKAMRTVDQLLGGGGK